MKIAFVVGKFPTISQTFIQRQITGLLERGYDVDIFAYSRGKDTVTHADVTKYGLLKRTYYLDTHGSLPNGIARFSNLAELIQNPAAVFKSLNVIRFGRSALSLAVLSTVAPFLNKGPYDIVHCQFGTLGNLGLLLKDTGILRGKLVTSFRGYDISSYTKTHGEQIYRNLISRGDLFLCVSENIKAKLVRLGCDPDKVIVHRSGAEMKSDWSRTVEDSAGKTRIVTIARLVEKKGVEYGVRAVAQILTRRRDVEYSIVGDGPLSTTLQSLIDDLNAGERIKLLGWKTQAEVTDLLKSSDILLAPSVTTEQGDEEGIPGVIMEAFAHGLPVVSTHHAGIPEVVRDGVSGFLVPERDAHGLAGRLERLIDDPGMRSAMGRQGRAFVEEHYDIEKLNDRLVRIYQKLLGGELPIFAPQPHISAGVS